ncbi:hypothetical protein [Synechococcus phage BUCT-ZZ01]|nr:hypothetical protein [Synechococcus phage BUCT-ZZ01]
MGWYRSDGRLAHGKVIGFEMNSYQEYIVKVESFVDGLVYIIHPLNSVTQLHKV